MEHEKDLDRQLLWSEIDPRDVDQEYAILAWKFRGTDKVPSKKLIYLRLKMKNREFLYWDEVPLSATAVIPVDEELPPSYEVIEKLIKWAADQDERVRNTILEFLDEPSEKQLQHILKLLRQAGLIPDEPEKEGIKTPRTIGSKKGTLVQLVLKALETAKPITELYELARNVMASKRPEAAVRQTLRRLQEEKLVIRVGEDLYVKAGAK